MKWALKEYSLALLGTQCGRTNALIYRQVITIHSRGPMLARRVPICSNAYGGWFALCARHSVRMTYRPSAALRLLGSLRISHNKFLRANKWILILILKAVNTQIKSIIHRVYIPKPSFISAIRSSVYAV